MSIHITARRMSSRWSYCCRSSPVVSSIRPIRYSKVLRWTGRAPPTLLIVGAEDHVVPLGQYASPAEAARLGDFLALSAAATQDIPRATRAVIPECGHIPHLEHPAKFLAELLPFLAE
jgi:pimeloyl-ACP methyl ester carboxylesterase